MKPAPFDYCCPDTLGEALQVLSAHAGNAKVMAGGQSLVPMLNFRVIRPELIVDVSRLIEFDYVRERTDGGLTIGALTRHRTLETSALVAARFPVIPQAMQHVAHLAIRNRGTIGGSLAHADPAAELPMLACLLDATLVARSMRGERQIAAADFFVAALTSALEDDEILVRVELPGLRHTGWAFDEVARRAGDFALSAVGVVLRASEGRIEMARIAMMGVGDTPLRCHEAEASLTGQALSDQLVSDVVKATCAGLEPRRDLHASPEFRRHLAGVLMERVLRQAWKRATGAAR
jgi:CO/xanthine dehydrogenase FAD-binding subunit